MMKTESTPEKPVSKVPATASPDRMIWLIVTVLLCCLLYALLGKWGILIGIIIIVALWKGLDYLFGDTKDDNQSGYDY